MSSVKAILDNFQVPALGSFVNFIWTLPAESPDDDLILRFFVEAGNNSWSCEALQGLEAGGNDGSSPFAVRLEDNAKVILQAPSGNTFPAIEPTEIRFEQFQPSEANCTSSIVAVPAALYNACPYTKALDEPWSFTTDTPDYKASVRLEYSILHAPQATFTLLMHDTGNSIVFTQESLAWDVTYTEGEGGADDTVTIARGLMSHVEEGITFWGDGTFDVEDTEEFCFMMTTTHHANLFNSLPSGSADLLGYLAKCIVPIHTSFHFIQPWWWFTGTEEPTTHQTALNDIRENMVTYALRYAYKEDYEGSIDTSQGTIATDFPEIDATYFRVDTHTPRSFFKPLPDIEDSSQPFMDLFFDMRPNTFVAPEIGSLGRDEVLTFAMVPILKGRDLRENMTFDARTLWNQDFGIQMSGKLHEDFANEEVFLDSSATGLVALTPLGSDSNMQHITNNVFVSCADVRMYDGAVPEFPLQQTFSPLLTKAASYTNADVLPTGEADTWHCKPTIAIRDEDIPSFQQLSNAVSFYLVLPGQSPEGNYPPLFTELTLQDSGSLEFTSSQQAALPNYEGYFGKSFSSLVAGSSTCLQGELSVLGYQHGSVARGIVTCLPKYYMSNVGRALIMKSLVSVLSSQGSLTTDDLSAEVLLALFRLSMPCRFVLTSASSAYHTAGGVLNQAFFTWDTQRSWMETFYHATTSEQSLFPLLLPSPASALAAPLLSMGSTLMNNWGTFIRSIHVLRVFIDTIYERSMSSTSSSLGESFEHTSNELLASYQTTKVNLASGEMLMTTAQPLVIVLPEPNGTRFTTWVAVVKQQLTSTTYRTRVIVLDELPSGSQELSLNTRSYFANGNPFSIDFYYATPALRTQLQASETPEDLVDGLQRATFRVVAGTDATWEPSGSQQQALRRRRHRRRRRHALSGNQDYIFSISFDDESGFLTVLSDDAKFYLTPTDEDQLQAWMTANQNDVVFPSSSSSSTTTPSTKVPFTPWEIAGLAAGGALGLGVLIGGSVWAAKHRKHKANGK